MKTKKRQTLWNGKKIGSEKRIFNLNASNLLQLFQLWRQNCLCCQFLIWTHDKHSVVSTPSTKWTAQMIFWLFSFLLLLRWLLLKLYEETKCQMICEIKSVVPKFLHQWTLNPLFISAQFVSSFALWVKHLCRSVCV